MCVQSAERMGRKRAPRQTLQRAPRSRISCHRTVPTWKMGGVSESLQVPQGHGPAVDWRIAELTSEMTPGARRCASEVELLFGAETTMVCALAEEC